MHPAAGARPKSYHQNAQQRAPAALPHQSVIDSPELRASCELTLQVAEPGSLIYVAAALLLHDGVTYDRWIADQTSEYDAIRRARRETADQPLDRAIDWDKYERVG